jgi:hypothetical protein
MPKLVDTKAWFHRALRVTEEPAASDWLKEALMNAINRDPVDVANDAQVLYEILTQRSKATRIVNRTRSKAEEATGSLTNSAARSRHAGFGHISHLFLF